MEAPAFTPHQRLMLGLLCGADCMVVLDFSIVNVAMPSIQSALNFTPQALQWLLTGYGLVFGGFMLLGGRLADLFGRKLIFTTGSTIFTCASFLGGLSTGPQMLIAMRCLQGLGAALLSPAALALLMGAFPEGPLRNRAIGIWGTVTAAGYSLGVVLGGILTSNFGWRWILFVNVPLGAMIILAAAVQVKEQRHDGPKPHLDIIGSILVTAGLMTLVYGLVKASQLGWAHSMPWSLFGLATLLLSGFIFVEKNTKEPMMPLEIFKLPGIAVANGISTLISAALVAMNLFLSLHFQNILGYSPIHTGLAFLPHGLAAILAGPLGGTLANRIGPKKVLFLGLVLTLVGMLLLCLIGTADTFWWHILPTMLLISAGVMPAFVTMTILATDGIKESEHGLISGILNTTGQLGGALGLAVLTAIAASRTSFQARIPGIPAPEAMVDGFRWGLGGGSACLILALILAWVGFRPLKSSN